MSIKKMVEKAEYFASSAFNLGYDQGQRWSFFNRSTNTPIPNKETDCSSLSGAVAKLGGYRVNLSDPFYSGNFKDRMVQGGDFNATSISGWGATKLYGAIRAGDFLVGPGHVVFCISPTRWLSAEGDERGRATGGSPGDQSGKEVRIRGPYMRPQGWAHLIRPKNSEGGSGGGGGGGTPTPTPTTTTTTVKTEPTFPKTNNEFIDTVAPYAVNVQRSVGIPAATIIAQAILESGWGNSRLSKEANALFGIKYSSAWPSADNPNVTGSYAISTREVDSSGREYYVNADFCAYPSWEASINDHALFLSKSRYQAAKDNYARTRDVDQYCRDIRTAGYATDPKYATKLINLINQYALRQFSTLDPSIPTFTTTTVDPSRTTTTTTLEILEPPEPQDLIFPNPESWYNGSSRLRPYPMETDTGWYIWQTDRTQLSVGFNYFRDRLLRRGFDPLVSVKEQNPAYDPSKD